MSNPLPISNAAALPPLAIIGIGCLFPKADGPGHFWANIKRGVDGITDVPATHWNPDDYFDADPKKPDYTYGRRGGFLDAVPFNPLEFGIAPRDLEATDTSQLLGLVAAKQALMDAGVLFTPLTPNTTPAGGEGGKTVDRSKVSVILGVTGTLELVVPLGARLGHPHWKRALKDSGVPDDIAAEVVERIGEAYVPWQENSFPGLLGNVVAGRIANRLDLHGTNCVVDAACASSLSAVHLAALELQTGKADVVVTGGVDTFNDIFMYMCFSKTPALSPTGNSKPFDATGDGTILGEGLGMVVLKRLSDAERDGDKIYAVLKGLGSSSDGKGNAIYAPSAEGQKRCLRDAYSRAGITPDTIELVEAHGTGTKVGDAAEVSALKEVFLASGGRKSPVPDSKQGADAPRSPSAWCAIGSVKSMIGHTKAAAGSASIIKAAMALFTKTLPPTLKVSQPVEPLLGANSPFYVNAQMRPWLPSAGHPRRAGVSAFGFGGSNFHAVLEEYSPKKTEPDWDGRVEIAAWSAPSHSELVKSIPLITDWNEFARAAEASRAAFDSEAPFRLLLVADRDRTDLAGLCFEASRKLESEPNAESWSLPIGAEYGRGPALGKLAILFPGQGSQQIQMLRDLACTFPEILESLAASNGDAPRGERLSDRIYPMTSFAPDAKAKQDEALRATEVAQPALGAVSFGAFRTLTDRFGVLCEHFAGHSYGELPALAAAGWIEEADFVELSRLRGRLMAEQRGVDSGSMLAVIGSPDDLGNILADQKLNVVVANRNSPKQTVLSGPSAEIERTEEVLKKTKLRAIRLPVAAAFHSPLVSEASKPFRAALDSISIRPNSNRVFSNTTAGEYPAEALAVRELLGAQLSLPVEFVREIRAMIESGVRTFLEVGPGTVLTKLVESIAAEGTFPVRSIALDASAGKNGGLHDLAKCFAALAARGHAVKLTEWERGSACRPAPPLNPKALTVPICGANLVSPRPKKPPRLAGTYPSAPLPTAAAGTRRMNETPELSGALQVTQQTLAALQKLQEQTASLHKQFLEQQEQAQRTLMALVQQQQSLLNPAGRAATPLLLPPPPPPPPVFVPAPVIAAPKPIPIPPPPPPVIVPPPPPAPKAVPVAQPSRIEKILLDVVAEKTGYPATLLNLGMTLDSDLGVDSIKRVEILSALQDKLPEAPVVKPEHLGQLHTLQDVAAFLAGSGTDTVFPSSELIPLPMPEPAETLAAPLTVHGLFATDELSSILGDVLAQPMPADAKGRIEKILLDVVSEKTGYPATLLNLGMTLDSDLGVDSIKRVEILSALQDKLPDAPVVKPEHLGQLHTLQDVAAFLAAGGSVSISELAPKTEQVDSIRMAHHADSTLLPHPELHAPPSTVVSPLSGVVRFGPPPAPPRPASSTNRTSSSITGMDKIDRSILQVVDLDLKALRPRLALPEGSEIWLIAPADDPFAKELSSQLTQRRFSVRAWPWVDPSIPMASGNPAGLILVAPTKTGAMPLNRLALRWVQQAGPKLRANGRAGAALAASIVRLDGTFGLTDLDSTADPVPGGLAGLLKTVRCEWPEISAKALDAQPAFAHADPAKAARAIVEELFLVGPVEVGVSATHRVALEPARTVRKSGSNTLTFSNRDVILVTGGARGVTAEVSVTLAETFQPTLVLLGRTPLPATPEPGWADGIVDEAQLKGAIAANLGGSPTPKAVGETYDRLIAQREIRATLARIEKAGGKAAYLTGDVANGEQLADLLHRIQVRHGTITAVIHAAGVLADRKLEDLTPEQFDRVYAPKVLGLRNLLDLLGGQELKALVLFSSTTARVGRAGQAAYAIANEVLNKTAQVESRRRPHCRVVAINWGPWDGGMVTPALRRVFENEGIGLIPLQEGGAFAVQELNVPGRAVEVIALGKLRAPKPESIEPPLPGIAAPAANITGTGPPQPELLPIYERTVDLASHPILRSHIINGQAVLPLALHMEWLAHAALHGNPGLLFHGFNELRVHQGVKVEEAGSVLLRAFAGRASKKEGGFFHVPVEFRSKRTDGRDALHSRGEVVLSAALPMAPARDRFPDLQPYPHPMEEIYKYFLFHGPELHALERLEGISETGFLGTAFPAPPPSEWFAAPLRGQWVSDPLAIDAVFQMMILWSYAQHGAGSLPNFLGRYRQYRRSFPAGPCRIAIRITKDSGSYARADIDVLDASDDSPVAQIRDFECVIDAGLNQHFRRNSFAPRAKA